MIDDLDPAIATTEEAGGPVHALLDEQEDRGEVMTRVSRS